MASLADDNRELGLLINREIWNNQRFELIPECFTEDFVADYSPRVVREGREQIEEMVRSAHARFQGFKETIRNIVTDNESIVLHFTITGKHVRDWGPIPASGRDVKHDEIVIMKVRDGKVYHQVGVIDALLALHQIGSIPDPAGYAKKSFE